MTYEISKADRAINGTISLDGSKSISNRALIIRALSQQDFPIDLLSTSKDTTTLNTLLSNQADAYDAGAAGTTFRFMTAFLALQKGTQTLTGSARMKQRPIGVLVEALRQLGAHIEYMETEGYPPLRIHTPQLNGTNKLSIPASTSSQFISALLMIAPTLPNGLHLTLEGKVVSRPYIEMTLDMLQYFGITTSWEEDTIKIQAQKYKGKAFKVEADWSAASYYYIMAAFADQLDLQLNGLWQESLQGDSAIVDMLERFGIQTTFNEHGVHLTKSGAAPKPMFEQNFLKSPDIAQSMAVCCGGLGTMAIYTGLETLKIKETDRITALQNELGKVQVWLSQLPQRFSKNNPEEQYMQEGKAQIELPTFATYEDHRMAMAFAPLAMLGKIKIEAPHVVVKSYPDFWKDIQSIGFKIQEL